MALSKKIFKDLIRQRVFICDGAMGTMLRQAPMRNPVPDLLNLTDPEKVLNVHRCYLRAGADIIQTNTFNCTRHTCPQAAPCACHDMAMAAVELARRAVGEFSTIGYPRYIAGTVGPPADGQGIAAVKDLVRVFVTAGVDLIILESAYTFRTAHAMLEGACEEASSHDIPLIFSVSPNSSNGKLFDGMPVQHILEMAKNYPLDMFGLNCGDNPQRMAQLLETIVPDAGMPLLFSPGAGLPDEHGNYACTPQEYAAIMLPLIRKGTIAIAGGCCGTTPAYIEALTRKI